MIRWSKKQINICTIFETVQFLHTHKTRLATMCCLRWFFFCWLCKKKLRRSDRAMGQLLCILVMFLFRTPRRVFPKMFLGDSAPDKRKNLWVLFQNLWQAAGFLCPPMRDHFLFEVSKHHCCRVLQTMEPGPKIEHVNHQRKCVQSM